MKFIKCLTSLPPCRILMSAAMLTSCLQFSPSTLNAESASYESRDDIPAQYKWDLNDIYPNWEAWDEGMEEAQGKIDLIVALKGELGSAPESLLKALKLQDELGIIAYRIYRYPALARATNSRDQESSTKLQEVQILFSKFRTATSWINPEILEIPEETVESWITADDAFAPYRFELRDLFRQQAHVLSEKEEKLLSFFSPFNRAPRSIYSELSTTDIKFETITLSNGEEVTTSHANYGKILATNRNQEDREKAFVSHYTVYQNNQNVYAAIMNSVAQRDWAQAQARGYDSCIVAALDDDNVPVEVYKNLINTVRANTAPLQRYHRLRKRVLELEKYNVYDGSLPLVDFDKTYDYDQARTWILDSVAPLGEDYVSKMKEAVGGGWIDVFETPGKRPGAFSAGVYGVHPYMLLNYNETMDSMFTLSHELGHTLHTLHSNEAQPFATSRYTIFVAEVASTFNENLLLDYLLERTQDPRERIALIQQSIRNITGTFYLQTLFADFELQVHERVEKGQPITAEVLNKLIADLDHDYYGDSIERNELLDVLWARIGHFYNSPFYVYQYATCFASSAQLYKQITEGPEEERKATRERYIDLLKSGGSDYPMNQLKTAGVDLSQPGPVEAVAKQLDGLIDQLEAALADMEDKI